MPMCGPFVRAVPIADAEPPKERAIAAYRRASEEIAAADYEEARLQLDLAYPGNPFGTHEVTLAAAEDVTGVDFGNVHVGEIHGVVYNLDGSQTMDGQCEEER